MTLRETAGQIIQASIRAVQPDAAEQEAQRLGFECIRLTDCLCCSVIVIMRSARRISSAQIICDA